MSRTGAIRPGLLNGAYASLATSAPPAIQYLIGAQASGGQRGDPLSQLAVEAGRDREADPVAPAGDLPALT